MIPKNGNVKQNIQTKIEVVELVEVKTDEWLGKILNKIYETFNVSVFYSKMQI